MCSRSCRRIRQTCGRRIASLRAPWLMGRAKKAYAKDPLSEHQFLRGVYATQHKNGGEVTATWPQIVWAAVTAGKAAGDEYAYPRCASFGLSDVFGYLRGSWNFSPPDPTPLTIVLPIRNLAQTDRNRGRSRTILTIGRCASHIAALLSASPRYG